MSTEKIAKSCPNCGKRLTIRNNPASQEDFLGCTEYPECAYTEPLPIDIQLKRKGALQFPNF